MIDSLETADSDGHDLYEWRELCNVEKLLNLRPTTFRVRVVVPQVQRCLQPRDLRSDWLLMFGVSVNIEADPSAASQVEKKMAGRADPRAASDRKVLNSVWGHYINSVIQCHGCGPHSWGFHYTLVSYSHTTALSLGATATSFVEDHSSTRCVADITADRSETRGKT